MVRSLAFQFQSHNLHHFDLISTKKKSKRNKKNREAIIYITIINKKYKISFQIKEKKYYYSLNFY